MEILSHSPKETKEFARRIAKKIKPGMTVALYGELGSGKTTFTRFLIEALGLSSRVQSPTFVIAKQYIGNKMVVNHIDLYRLTNSDEIEDLGLEEMFEDDSAINIIEWPELIEKLLPKDAINLIFSTEGKGVRRVHVRS